MNYLNENPSTAKSFKETHHILDSVAQSKKELTALLDRLGNDINYQSEKHQSSLVTDGDCEVIERINQLKVHYMRLKSHFEILNEADQEQWQANRELVSRDFENARRILQG